MGFNERAGKQIRASTCSLGEHWGPAGWGYHELHGLYCVLDCVQRCFALWGLPWLVEVFPLATGGISAAASVNSALVDITRGTFARTETLDYI